MAEPLSRRHVGRLYFGSPRWSALVLAMPFLAVAIFLVIAERPGFVLKLALFVIAAVLAFRAAGLRRFVADVTPKEGHVRIETEFDDPEESSDR